MKLIGLLSVVSLVALLTANCLTFVIPALATSATENTWEIKSPMPGAIEGGKAEVVNGKIYVIGGSANYEYDPVKDTWTAKKPMPTPRQWFGIAVYQNKIFTFGGSIVNNGNPTYYAVNEVYDPATDTWQTKQPMPTIRLHLSASTIGNLIYLIGGMSGEPIHEALALNEMYNVANDSWITKEPMPYPVDSDSSAVCAGKIYVIGGSSIQIYDSLNNSWRIGTSMLSAQGAFVSTATTGTNAPRKIYVIGGFGYNYLDDLVQVYNPENNTWGYGTRMPTARGTLTAAVVNDKIYAIGGNLHRNNEVYTPFGYGRPDPAYVFEHTPPKLSLLSPLSQTYNTTNVSLVFTMDKAVSWAGYSLNGKANITTTNNTTLTGLSRGLYNVTVYANDTFGNMATSETSNFTVTLPTAEHSEPSPILIVVAASGATGLIVAVGLLVYLKKHRRAV